MKLAVLVLILLGFMTFTNPPLEDHKAAVKTEYMAMIDEEIDNSGLGKLKTIGKGLGGMILDGAIDSRISRANYIAFSLTQIQRNNEKEIIGVGVFGNVFLLADAEEMKEKLKEKIDAEFNID